MSCRPPTTGKIPKFQARRAPTPHPSLRVQPGWQQLTVDGIGVVVWPVSRDIEDVCIQELETPRGVNGLVGIGYLI